MAQRRKRLPSSPPALALAFQPQSAWCTDYKGEFMLGDKRYCYPLTVTDHSSRYLLLCEAMESNAEKHTFTAFERLFRRKLFVLFNVSARILVCAVLQTLSIVMDQLRILSQFVERTRPCRQRPQGGRYCCESLYPIPL
jgi:hypothetical protein